MFEHGTTAIVTPAAINDNNIMRPGPLRPIRRIHDRMLIESEHSLARIIHEG